MVEKSDLSPSVPDWWSRFYEPMRQAGQRVAEFFSPSSEAAVTGDAYEISVELPGVAEDDIHVELHEGRLSVTGEKKASVEEKGKNYYFSERTYGSFQRVFRLPDDADQDKVVANYKDGVLTVKVAKRVPKAPESKKIEIRRA